jgi:hypothetical protein
MLVALRALMQIKNRTELPAEFTLAPVSASQTLASAMTAPALSSTQVQIGGRASAKVDL